MKLRPLADNVIVKMLEPEETTISGIILSSSAKEKPQIAEVLTVGPGGLINGKEVKMSVSVGDKVVMNKYSGSEMKIDNEEFVVIKNSDILAIVE